MNALLGQLAAVEAVVCADGSAVAWRGGRRGRIAERAADRGPDEMPTSLCVSEISS
jgi:hypothetical protein